MERRLLTSAEITFVLQDIVPRGSTVLQHVVQKHRKVLEEQLQTVRIVPSSTVIDKLKSEITRQFYKSQIAPADSVGVIAAQSIGERQTQLVLNSFHFSGLTIDTVVTGVPRFAELLSATKNPKNIILTIHTLHPCTTIQETRDLVISTLAHVTFGKVLASYTVENASSPKPIWYNAFEILYGISHKEYEHYASCKLHLEILYKYKLSLEDIATRINETYVDIHCVWSSDYLGQLDIWVDTSNMESVSPTLSPFATVVLYFEEVIIPMLSSLTLCGIPGVEQVFYKHIPASNRWCIETIGGTMSSVLALDYVDDTVSCSNNMWEICKTLGIEAVRQFLIEEFIQVISVDSYINARHIQLLVDVMLYTGSISSISRYGVHRNQSGALTKSSFEESLEQFLKAGIYGECERTNGVSAAIMCGKTSYVGTGLCDLVYTTKTEVLDSDRDNSSKL